MNKILRIRLLSVVAAFFVLGCHQAESSSEFQLKVVKLRLGSVPLQVEVADTPATQEVGLMFRDALPENRGMLFVFDRAKQANFWMKNTKIALSIAYVDSKQVIREIYNMKPLDTNTTPSRSGDIRYAIEVNTGWFDRHQVKAGLPVSGIPR